MSSLWEKVRRYEEISKDGLVVDVGDLVAEVLGEIEVAVRVEDLHNARPVRAHTSWVRQEEPKLREMRKTNSILGEGGGSMRVKVWVRDVKGEKEGRRE